MHAQLQALADEFHFATARLHALVRAVPGDKWAKRNDPDRWSVAECVTHLNLTGAAYADILKRALDGVAGRKSQVDPATRYRRDFWGWMLWKMMPPPVRFRTKTIARFIPESLVPRDQMIAEFEKWQEVQVGYLAAAEGLDLGRILVTSPFNAELKYNLYSCFSILPAHQHRHLWQAEQVWSAP